MKSLHHQLYAAGFVLFLFPGIFFILATFFGFLGISVSGWMLLPSLISAMFIVHIIIPEAKNPLVWIGLSAGVLLLSGVLAGCYFDMSFDGQWYHQDAIGFLKEGWNPIWDHRLLDTEVSGMNANYVNCYPKAAWYFQAGIFSAFNNVEYGKALHLIGNFSLGMILCAILRHRFTFSWLKSIVLALLCCTSTITLGQIFSFYVDGVLFSYLGIFLLLLLDYLHFEKRVFVGLLCCFVFLVNLKFTGLIYALVGCFLGITYLILLQRKIPMKFLWRISIMVLSGVVIIGYPTYVKNTIDHQHPFFPIMGPNNEGNKIAEVQYPKDFFARNRFQKAWVAHTSLPIYTDHEHPSVAKPLFTSSVVSNSLPYYKNHQPVTMSPFGPLEAELWLLFIPLLFLFFWRKVEWSVYFLFFGVVLSIVIQPEFWNLRYAPQVLLLLALVCGVLMQDRNKWIQGSSFVFVLLFTANNFITVYQNWNWVHEKSKALEASLNSLSRTTVPMQQGWMRSFSYKLKKYNIQPDFTQKKDGNYINFPGDSFTGWTFNTHKP